MVRAECVRHRCRTRSAGGELSKSHINMILLVTQFISTVDYCIRLYLYGFSEDNTFIVKNLLQNHVNRIRYGSTLYCHTGVLHNILFLWRFNRFSTRRMRSTSMLNAFSAHHNVPPTSFGSSERLYL
jgi:hypothetical protein